MFEKNFSRTIWKTLFEEFCWMNDASRLLRLDCTIDRGYIEHSDPSERMYPMFVAVNSTIFSEKSVIRTREGQKMASNRGENRSHTTW
jgi:hypothetical protein